MDQLHAAPLRFSYNACLLLPLQTEEATSPPTLLHFSSMGDTPMSKPQARAVALGSPDGLRCLDGLAYAVTRDQATAGSFSFTFPGHCVGKDLR